MIEVGTFAAKTHLTSLLDRVQAGERIVITRRGKPVAMLVPHEQPGSTDIAAHVREMLEWRDRHGPTLGKDLTLRQLIEEGRRY
jgi:prevent-host-death family protein